MPRIIRLDQPTSLPVRRNPEPKRNWFNTLNEALESEGLVYLWPLGRNVGYGETVGLASGGRWISVYRDERGMYERPVHYATRMEATI